MVLRFCLTCNFFILLLFAPKDRGGAELAKGKFTIFASLALRRHIKLAYMIACHAGASTGFLLRTYGTKRY